VNVVLVNPPQPGLVDPYTYPPVGLAYVQAAVRRERPDVGCSILNLAGATVAGARAAILVEFPDVVGYTATTTYWRETCALARAVESANASVCQVVGGPHPTVTGQTDECFDATFVGPGEGSFVRFLRDCEDGGCQLLYMPEDADIEARAVPAPEEVLGGRLHSASAERTAVVFSGFGCTGNCAFCAARGMYRRIALRSVESVTREIEGIVAHGIRDVRFMDDTFAVDMDRTTALCERIAGLGVRWGCVLRVDQVTPALLGAMKVAGCVEVGFGIESFDQRVLDALRKQTTVAQNVAAVHMAHNAGLAVHLFMMISTPGETAGRTVELNIAELDCLRSKFTRLLLSTLMPYPGSAIYRDPARFGALLIEPDPTTYNQHQYHGRDAAEAMVWSPLLLDGLTRDQQLANIRAMREYSGALRQVNHGHFEGHHE